MTRGLAIGLWAALLFAGTGCRRDPVCDTCSDDATCSTASTPATCTCNEGFVGDGLTCNPIPTVHIEVVERSGIPFVAHTPLWVAGQVGDGAYTVLSGTNGVYEFPVPDASGKYAVVVVCRGFDLSLRVTDYRSTAAEATSQRIYCTNAVEPPDSDIDFFFTNGGTGATTATAILAVGASVSANGPVGGSSTRTVPNGSHDLVAYTKNAGNEFVRGLLLHDINVSADGNRTLDFDTGFDFVTSSATLTNTTPADNTLALQSGVVTREFFTTFSNVTTNGATIRQVPAFALTPHDLNMVALVASGTDSRQRGIFRFGRTTGNVGLAAPDYPATAVVDIAESVPFNRVRIQWSGGPANAAVLNSTFQSPGIQVLTFASPGWLGGERTVTFPAVSTLTGWDNTWAPVTGSLANWIFYGNTSNRAAAALYDFAGGFTGAEDGMELGISSRGGSFTP